AAAEDERPRLRNHRLHEDIQLPSADETFVVGGILAQAEREVPGLAGFDDFASGGPDLSLDASTADGAHHGAVLADQELGALVAGNGAIDLHDGRDGALLPEVAQAHDFVVEIHSD